VADEATFPAYFDGWQSLPSGMDAGRSPSLIQKDQVAQAINTTFRGGFPRARPKILYRPIAFRTDEERDWYENQLYQGSFYYSYIAATNPALKPNRGCLIQSIGGRQWNIDLTNFTAFEITPNRRNGRFQNICYFCQARQYLIIQDGTSSPIIWDGSNSRRAGRNEVPVGTIMAYGQGRIWLIKGDELFAGDIEGLGIGSVLKFTEFQNLTGGGALNPSYVIGNVNGLQFIPQQDTATGVGTLLVLGERGVTSVFAELPREQWINGIQRVVLINLGGTGHRSPTQVNGDVWFRNGPGLRSYRQARGQVQALAQLPLSTEMDPFFLQDTDFLLPWSSSVYFDNRVLHTLSPQNRNGRVTFPAVAAVDFHILSSFGSDRSPAWDGIWTGANFFELVQATTQRMFAPGVDTAGRNCLYEWLKTDNQISYDVLDDGERGLRRSRVVWSTDSAKMDFTAGTVQGGPAVQKRLNGGKYYLRDIQGELDVQLQYRKDGEECWREWVTHEICANTDLCDLPLGDDGCPITFVAAHQYRSPLKLPQPDIANLPPDDSPVGAGNSGRALNIGYEFQFRFIVTGEALLYTVVFEATAGSEPETAFCPEPECTTSFSCCEVDNPYSYTPVLGPYYVSPNGGVDAAITEAENAVINYLGANPGATTTEIVNDIPLPPSSVGPAINHLYNNGQIVYGNGGWTKFVPIHII
jgi:hypothetical protein